MNSGSAQYYKIFCWAYSLFLEKQVVFSDLFWTSSNIRRGTYTWDLDPWWTCPIFFGWRIVDPNSSICLVKFDLDFINCWSHFGWLLKINYSRNNHYSHLFERNLGSFMGSIQKWQGEFLNKSLYRNWFGLGSLSSLRLKKIELWKSESEPDILWHVFINVL